MTKEIRKLNTLRGFAALLVVLDHYSNKANWMKDIFGGYSGQAGVMIFYILSGFLMAYLYFGKEFCKAEVRNYAVKRFSRVIPLYFVVVLLSFYFYRFGKIGIFYHIPDIPNLISHLLFLHGTFVLWSIPPEVHFYILFILLWWVYSIKKDILFLLFSIGLLFLILFEFPLIRTKILGAPINIEFFSTVQYFLAGILFGHLYRNWKAPQYLVKKMFVIVLIILPLLNPNFILEISKHRIDVWRDVGVMYTVSFVFFIFLFYVPDQSPLISNRVGDLLGKISYSWYLLHIPVLYTILETAKKDPNLYFGFYMAASIIIAYISYRLIENPARYKIQKLILT